MGGNAWALSHPATLKGTGGYSVTMQYRFMDAIAVIKITIPTRRLVDLRQTFVGRRGLLPPPALLRTVPIGDNRLQLGSVGGAQFDLGSFVHSPDTDDRFRRENLKRIEMSDLAH